MQALKLEIDTAYSVSTCCPHPSRLRCSGCKHVECHSYRASYVSTAEAELRCVLHFFDQAVLAFAPPSIISTSRNSDISVIPGCESHFPRFGYCWAAAGLLQHVGQLQMLVLLLLEGGPARGKLTQPIARIEPSSPPAVQEC